MKFTKMHGCGNDYVYINGKTEDIPQDKKPEIVRFLSNRHFGVGSDGVIFIYPSLEADFEMEMWNADGTRAEMCGNGIRCVGKYVYEYGLTKETKLKVTSAGKLKFLQLQVENGEVISVRVNMGAPKLSPRQIPVTALEPMEKMVAEPFCIAGRDFRLTCVSMGNPHAVVFLDEVDDFKDLNSIGELNIEEIGPAFENNVRFPERINTEFVKVIDRNHVEMRVWERGTGETLACGTGCCAVVVACVLNHRTDNRVLVRVSGGEIEVEWDRKENRVYMTGPATAVFEGEMTKEALQAGLRRCYGENK